MKKQVSENNLSKEDRNKLVELTKNPSIIIQKADKDVCYAG